MGRTDKPTYFERIANEIKSIIFWRDVSAEFVATFFLVSVQCAVPLQWDNPVLYPNGMQIGLAMGFIIIVMAEAFGDISGAHMNPAVTISMVVANQVTIFRGLLYVIVQCIGGIAGAGFVYGVTASKFRGSLARTTVHADIEQYQGMFVEMWLTFILVNTIWGATNRRRRRVFMPSLPIGFAIALDIMTGIHYTGASMNPARSLGPALVTNVWDDQWVYWVGPILGGLLATLVYHFFFDKIGSGDLPEDAETSYLQTVIIEALEQRVKEPYMAKTGV